jgi:hypothetical protein
MADCCGPSFDFGIGPYGASYLFIDYGRAAGGKPFESAKDLIEAVASFGTYVFNKKTLTEPEDAIC